MSILIQFCMILNINSFMVIIVEYRFYLQIALPNIISWQRTKDFINVCCSHIKNHLDITDRVDISMALRLNHSLASKKFVLLTNILIYKHTHKIRTLYYIHLCQRTLYASTDLLKSLAGSSPRAYITTSGSKSYKNTEAIKQIDKKEQKTGRRDGE